MVDDVLFTSNNFDAEKELNRVSNTIKSNGKQIDLDIKGKICVDEECFSFCENDVKGAIKWTWHIKERENDTLLMASIKNTTDKTVIISDIEMSACIEKEIEKSKKPRIFLWHSWDMRVAELENKKMTSENLLHISGEDKKTFFAGFVTLSRTKIYHAIENGKWTAYMDIGKYHLKAGDTFNTEILLFCEYADPYFALEDWANKIYKIYDPKVNTTPTVCWGAGSMRPDGEVYENFVLENLDVINNRFRNFGINHVWTSQMNLKDYIPGNWLKNNDEQIPSGLKKFTADIKEKGFRHGVWMSPFWFFKEAEGAYDEHKHHLVHDKYGNPIITEGAWCWKFDDDDLPTYHMHRCSIDGTHPDSIKYVKDIFSTYRDIGVRYYMLDFLDIHSNADYYDKSKTPWQAGYDILRLVRETAGDDTHMQTAVSSSPAFTGIINAARVGRDFGEGRPIDRDELNDFKNATHVFHDNHYANLKAFLTNAACNYFTHQKTYMNDMNVLFIDTPYPLEYSRFAVTLFGLQGSTPIVLCGDMRYMAQERVDMMKLTLPRTEYSSRPVDLFDRYENGDYSRVQVLNVKNDFDEYTVVGVFNPDQTLCTLDLDFEKLGLDGEYAVYDFWNMEYRGIFHTSFPLTLLPETCKLFRFTKKRNHPWVIGSNMHIQQGVSEIKELHWNEEQMTLSGVCKRPAGENGKLIVLTPPNFKLLNRGKCHIIKELLDYNIVIEVPLDFETDTAEFTLRFEPWNFKNITPRGFVDYSNMEEMRQYMKKNYKRENTRIF